MQIEITDKDIEDTEKILLPKNFTFDKERRDFIKDLSTLDLQAVPGSGKTTALLSKLIILEHKLPFDDNSGILVISHTNAAVDEIKNKIGLSAPKLFEYPNFIGTVQSFVDTFLAIPFYTNEYKHRPYRIDDEIYYERCVNMANSYSSLTGWLKNQRDPINTLFSLELSSQRNLSFVNGLKDRTKPTFQRLEDFKLNTINEGLLKYSEAFALANEFINKYPLIKNILRKRFSFVFIDEMQDLEQDKYNLLETLFFDNQNENHCFQRIGDINQSIYSQGAEVNNCVWTFRHKKLQICGSQRLNPNIAKIVQRFAVEKQTIEGRRKNNDNTEISIKPYLIIYEKDSINKVILKYINIIRDLKEKHLLFDSANEKYIVAGWRKRIDNKKPDKYCISDYWQNFITEDIKSKIDYDSLSSYLKFYDKSNLTLESIRKNILNALLKMLRYENVKDLNNRFYSKRTMIDFIKDSGNNNYEEFKDRLYKWCINTINKDNSVIIDLRNYIPKFLKLFNATYVNSKSFVENIEEETLPTPRRTRTNTICFDDFNISIQSVHSIKGQTCTGILYLETFKGSGSSKKTYESQKLAPSLCGQDFSELPKQSDYIKAAAKMMYVGFSRPTHLLCFAVQKDRFDEYLSNINTEEWEIVNI